MTSNGDPYQTVQQGERLEIPARAWNTLMGIAREDPRQSTISRPGARSSESSILVKNNSAEDVPRFGVLAIGGPLILPSDNSSQFLDRLLFKGEAVTPSNAHDFVITLEPIVSGKIGRCLIHGLLSCTIDIGHIGHRYARAVGGSKTLKSAASGPVKIIWSEPSVGNGKYAYVELGVDCPMLAVITDAESLGGNKWEYSWEEVEINDGQFTTPTDGKTSALYGLAHNINEARNSGDGVQGNGVDLANLQGTNFTIRPIGIGAAVYLTGPHTYSDESKHWLFSATNTVDGSC